MINWFAPSIVSLISFGLWGLFTKLSVEHIDFKSAIIYQTLGVILVGFVSLSLVGFRPSGDIKGFTYAVLTGFAYALGCLFYFIAASRGKIITVVTFTALYPMITIILSYYFLKETVSLKQMFGIGLAFFSMFLMLD